MQETLVWSPGGEDPVEKGRATHSSILAWRIPWTEEPGGLQSMGLQRVRHNWATNTFTFWILSQFSHYLEKETCRHYVQFMAKVVSITGETHSCYKPLTILSSHPRVGLLLPEQFCWYTFTDSTRKHYWSTMLMFFKNELSFGYGMVTLKISQMRELLNSLYYLFRPVQFSSVQSLSRVRLFATPWMAAHQASLSITNSGSSLKLMSIKLVMPSSHLILCRPLLLLPPIPPSQSFPMSQLFAWGGQSIGVSALASALPNNTQGLSPLEWTGLISLQSKGLSRVFSNTTLFKSINSLVLSFLHSSTLTSIHDYWKNHSLD